MMRGEQPIDPNDAGPALVAFWLAIAFFVAVKVLEWPWGR